ncbi:MAG: alpha/beta fold hydrolase [Flavobacteriaceae bacterium]|nr:alpha/beta fold hydrolase [Flavobacteriaceae bacterium]
MKYKYQVSANITIPNPKARTIIADLYRTAAKGAPLVIFCHGYKGFKDWGAWSLVAENFAASGFDFLKFNFSLNGGTLEQPIDFPDEEAFAQNTYSQELKDVETVICWAQERLQPTKIALVGHSRGGGIALLAAAQNEAVSAIATWAAVSDFETRFPTGEALAHWKKTGKREIINQRTQQVLIHNYSFYTDFFEHKNRLDLPKWVAQLKKPLLIVHGKRDDAVALSHAEQLHRWAPQSEQLLIAHATHTFNSRHPWGKPYLPKPLQEAVDHTKLFFKKSISLA